MKEIYFAIKLLTSTLSIEAIYKKNYTVVENHFNCSSLQKEDTQVLLEAFEIPIKFYRS